MAGEVRDDVVNRRAGRPLKVRVKKGEGGKPRECHVARGGSLRGAWEVLGGGVLSRQAAVDASPLALGPAEGKAK
jgi:hypothetical protein